MTIEVLIFLAVTAALLILVFIKAFSALLYALPAFLLGEAQKLTRGWNVLALIISFGKVFIISLMSFSFFVYAASFLLRIEGDFFKQKLEHAIEEAALSEKEPLLPREESAGPPLFDFLIQVASRQHEGKQLTFVFAVGGVFGLLAILIMAIEVAHWVRNKRHHEA